MSKKKKLKIKGEPIVEKEPEVDWWDEISEAEKASIERGLADIKAGRVVPHEVVRKKYLRWLDK